MNQSSTPPAITVVMATRNSAAHVAEALASITAQQVDDLEVVVIDAASTDATPEIVAASPQTRWEQQTGTGLWQAWNQAIAGSSADFIAFLDSDDRWEPGALAVHREQFTAHPQAAASIGRVRFFLSGSTVPAGIRPELLQGAHRGAMPGASLIRREVFDRLGPFPEDLPTASDIEWFLRLRQSGLPIAEPDAVVLAKRLHGESLGAGFPQVEQYDRDLIRIARESLARHRSMRGVST